jgi:hypothetical protein
MRSTALIALLPLLATLATARPHDHHHSHKHDRDHGLQRQRKTLSFGPKHGHASFETIDTPVVPLGIDVGGLIDVDPKEVARAFIAHKIGGNEGESFYLREDVSAAGRGFIVPLVRSLPRCLQPDHAYGREVTCIPRPGEGAYLPPISHLSHPSHPSHPSIRVQTNTRRRVADLHRPPDFDHAHLRPSAHQWSRGL